MAHKKKLRPESISGGYGAIPWAVLDSVSFKGASDKAKALLFALMRQHNGSNNGRLHLAKEWLYKHGWTCDESNRKACHELIARGLIIQTRRGGLNMGAHLFAVTWYPITSYVGLDITAQGFIRSAYALCTLPPTPRRKPPVKKHIERHDDRASSSTMTETVSLQAGSMTEPVKTVLATFTGTISEHNVITPLLPIKTAGRMVGVQAEHNQHIK